MLYIKIDGDANVVNYCKNCAYVSTDKDSKTKSRLISATDVNNDETVKLNMYMNADIIYDPTMPHVTNIDCPNKDCISKGKAETKNKGKGKGKGKGTGDGVGDGVGDGDDMEGTSKGVGVSNDVIFVKFDSTNMKYLYMCVHCKKFWKN
jgi:hypothetical protein